MNEYGITRYCVVCHHPFNCTDGDYFCSSKCSDEWELRECYADEIED
jgi:predicted nucleic acid-binding Zn ribbon protein